MLNQGLNALPTHSFPRNVDLTFHLGYPAIQMFKERASEYNSSPLVVLPIIEGLQPYNIILLTSFLNDGTTVQTRVGLHFVVDEGMVDRKVAGYSMQGDLVVEFLVAVHFFVSFGIELGLVEVKAQTSVGLFEVY
jgi:hypothetical protein